MTVFDPAKAYPIWLEVQAPEVGADAFTVTLTDDEGSTGSSTFRLDLVRSYPGGWWGEFLSLYLQQGPGADRLTAFGHDLFRALIFELPEVRAAWSKATSAAGQRPLAVTVELGQHTESLAALPLELLHDEVGFLFARPGSSLTRTYQATPGASYSRPSAPRVLFVWACPPGSGHPFNAEPHAAALMQVFGEKRVERFDDATVGGIRERLQQAKDADDPFHYLHLLAHGYRDDFTAGVCLCKADGGLDPVQAQSLAQAVAGFELRLAFLCSCQTAVANGAAFSGVGQQLLAQSGGDLPCVIATQANLPVRGSAELSERFYRHLGEYGEPAAALARARREAFDSGGAWSVPVLIARPERRRPERPAIEQLAGVPAQRTTYLSRTECEEEILTALRASRLVSVVGLPGIGKTEVGKEGARQARDAGLCQRVLYREANQGMDTRLLRKLLATPLGLPEVADDEQLALAFEGLGEEVLLVIDNAEDLMRNDPDQAAFRDQLDTLLQHTTRLRILLTTRWLVGATSETERPVDVPLLPRKETSELLKRELRLTGAFKKDWPATAAWGKLLDLIDGHALMLTLIAGHFNEAWATPDRICDRLLSLREKAVVTSDLLGRTDSREVLKGDKNQRLLSLVATMELSFEILEKRHPDAAEIFAALSLFPAGLPYSVAQEVAGGSTSTALANLAYFHMVQPHADRIFYPVPLLWYAEEKRKERPVDEDLYRRRALEGFATFAEECDALILGGADLQGIDRLLIEQRTLENLADHPPPSAGSPTERSAMARLGWAVQNGLSMADQEQLAERLAQAGLDEARQLGDRQGEASCLFRLGVLKMRFDDLDAAQADYEAALPIFREIRARLGEANCLLHLGLLKKLFSNLNAAQADYEAALTIFREIRDRLGEANCLKSLGDLKMRFSDLDAAQADCEAALTIFREIRDRMGEANCLKSLGDLKMRFSDLDEAQADYEAALPIFREIRDRLGEANCLKSLGDLKMRFSDLNAAQADYEAALTIFREIRDRLGEANCLQGLGRLDLATGRRARAFRAFLEVLEVFQELRYALGVQAAWGYLAQTANAGGEADQALVLAEESLTVGRRIRDVYGQTINLQLQVQVWWKGQQGGPALAALWIHRGLCRQIRDEARAQLSHAVLEEKLPTLPDETRQAIAENAEEIRRAAVAEAAERLRAAGREALTPLGDDEPAEA